MAERSEKKKKERKKNQGNPKSLKPISHPKTQKFAFCAYQNKNIIKHSVRRKKAMLS